MDIIGLIAPTAAERTALFLSLKVATAASVCSLPVAVASAWLLARREFLGKSVFVAMLHMPLVVPPVVLWRAALRAAWAAAR